MTRLRALFAAASTLLLAACPVAGMHVLAGDFTLAVSPAAPLPGDTVRMIVTVGNPGNDTLRLAFDADCVVTFYVRSDPDGAVLEPGAEPRCGEVRETIVLAPGAARPFEHHWITPAAAPHAYTAYAILGEHYVLRDGDRDYKAGHRSNEVPIQVRPR
jgi:hypothetical protein